MTREEAIRHIESIKPYAGRNIKDALDMAIKALEQEPCEDAISRQAAIDAIFAEPLYKPGMNERYAEDAVPAIFEKIKSLPPVQPQPDTARRIVGKSRGGMTLWYQCEICNEPVDAQDTFCNGCGRRLVDGCEKQAEDGR